MTVSNNQVAKAFVNAIKESAKSATPMSSGAFMKSITRAVSQPKSKVNL